MPLDFDHTSTQYSLKNALFLAEASELAYQPASVIADHAKQIWGLPKFQSFDKNEAEGFMVGNEDVIILSFRGTEVNKIKDWLSDAKFPYIKGPWGSVHEGFSASVDFIWPDILNSLNLFRDNNQAIWVTGHSLGAAMAVIASAKLFNAGKSPNGVYTFGQPRVGNGEFTGTFDKRFGQKYVRFVNNTDIVTHVPSVVPLGYQHIGKTCLYFDEGGKFTMNYPFFQNMVFEYSLLALKMAAVSVGGASTLVEELAAKSPRAIEDHGMENYMRNLRAINA